MYNQFFQFSALPFRLTPDRAFFHAVSQHAEILESFRDSRARGPGFRVVTGEIGAGKTMLFRVMRAELEALGALVAEFVSSNVSPEDLLDVLAAQFGIGRTHEKPEDASDAILAFLAEARANGRRVALFIDEAQNLPRASIEALFPLVDQELEGQPAIEVFLLGQPELQRVFDPASSDEASRRVVWQHHLRPLSPEDTRSFILHRLGKAGWKGDPAFTEGALRLIHRQTGGVPRRIIVICNRLMVHAQLEELHTLNSASVFEVLQDAESEGLPIGQALDVESGLGGEGEIIRQPIAAPTTVQPFLRPRPEPPSPVRDPPQDLVRAVERALGESGQTETISPNELERAAERAIGSATEEPRAPPEDLVAAVEKAMGADGSGRVPATVEAEDANAAFQDSVQGGGATQVAAVSTEGVTRRPSRAEVILGHSRTRSPDSDDGPDDTEALRSLAAESAGASRSARLAASLAAGICVLLFSRPIADTEPGFGTFVAPEDVCVDCPVGRDAAISSVAESGPPPTEPSETPETVLALVPEPSTQSEPPATASIRQPDAPSPPIELLTLPTQGSADVDEEAKGPSLREDPQGSEVSDQLRNEVSGVTAEVDDLGDSLAELRQSLAELRSQSEALESLRTGLEKLNRAQSEADPNRDASEPDELAGTGLPVEPEPLRAETSSVPDAQAETVSLIELVLTRRVVDREPSDEVENFSLSEASAFAFARVRNVGPPQEISFVWYRGTEVLSIAKLKVGTSRAWRTWSEVDLLPGYWRVEVYSSARTLIGEKTFFVTN